MEAKSKKAILWVVAFALCTYLIASISHVAFVFRLFEPSTPAYINLWVTQIDFYQIESYAEAIGIDVVTSLLITFCLLQKKKQNTALLVFIIVTLVLYSIVFNFAYTSYFNPLVQGHIWGIRILFGLFSLGDILPSMVSAYPLFILAYTLIAIFTRDVKEMSPDELKAEADRLEQITLQRQRIQAAKRQGRNASMIGAIDSTADITSHVVSKLPPLPFRKDKKQTDTPAQTDTPTKAASTPVEALAPIETASAQDTGPITLVTASAQIDLTPVEVTASAPTGYNGNGHTNGNTGEMKIYRSRGKTGPDTAL